MEQSATEHGVEQFFSFRLSQPKHFFKVERLDPRHCSLFRGEESAFLTEHVIKVRQLLEKPVVWSDVPLLPHLDCIHVKLYLIIQIIQALMCRNLKKGGWYYEMVGQHRCVRAKEEQAIF